MREGEQERIFKRVSVKRWQIKGCKLIPQDTAHADKLSATISMPLLCKRAMPMGITGVHLVRIHKHG